MRTAVPSRSQPAGGRPKRPHPVRLIVGRRLVGVYALLFVLLNSEEVEVSFVFFSTQISLVVALGLALASGSSPAT